MKTRNGIAIIFSFWGDSVEVTEFMQETSHQTRSYYINANRLKGFLIPYSMTDNLRRAHISLELQDVTKYQQVDMKALLSLLESMQNDQQRFDYLSVWCPCLHIYVLQKRGKKSELAAYMETCKSYENHWPKYSLYIHGYWLPHLE